MHRFLPRWMSVVLFLIFSTCFFSGNAIAFFIDDFNLAELDQNVWMVYHNQGTVEVASGELQVKRVPAGSNKTPYIHTKENTLFPLTGPFTFEIRFRYTEIGNFGTAITISSDSVPPNGINPDSNLNSYMKFMIYQDGPNGLSYGKIICDRNEQFCSTRTFLRPFTHVPDTNYHVVKLTYTKNGEYYIHIDNDENPEFISSPNQPRPKFVWVGNSMTTGTSDRWSSIHIDYIKVEAVEERKPVVILPGFGGSWDIDAVLAGVPGNNWSVPEFVKEYDGIRNSLINAGYKEGEDLFVFGYDWRKNLDSLADDLKQFLVDKNLDDNEINIVGHSMGGLVARSYLQKYNNTKVKVVTVGSPHMGILDAYGMWEGMTVWDAVWWQKALHFIATEVNKKPGEMRIESARRNAPSIKDLLPTWQFLTVNGTAKEINQMTWKNDYLLQNNSGINNYLDRIVSGFSEAYQTKSKLLATPRTKEDALLGLWADGKPIQKNPFSFSLGDGYVTSDSSSNILTNKLNMTGGHSEVISKKENIIKLLTEIGVATESAVGSTFEDRKNFLVFKLNSPGKMSVCLATICNGDLGLFFESQKMLIAPSYQEADYNIKIDASGETGKYEILSGKIGETAQWDEAVGNLKTPDQIDTYVFKPKTNKLQPNKDTALSNLNFLLPNGIDTKKVNTIRQEILRNVDKAMKTSDVALFDKEIDKWKAIDSYMTSVTVKDFFAGFSFSDFEQYSRGLYKARSLPKMQSYFNEELFILLKQIESDLENEKRFTLKSMDKKFQLIALKHFLGHAYSSFF